MPRRKKQFWKLNLRPQSAKSLIALVLILSGILSFLSFVGYIANLDNSLYGFLRTYFGASAFFVPFLLISAGLSLTAIKWEIAQSRIFWGITLVTVGFLTIFHLLINSEESLSLAQTGAGGGVIGFYIGRFLVSIFSIFGAFVLAIGSIVIGLLILFNTTLEEFGSKFSLVVGPIGKLFSSVASLRRSKQDEETEGLSEEEQAQALSQEIKINKPQKEMLTLEVIEEDGVSQNREMTHKEGEEVGIRPYELPPLSLLADEDEIAADRGDVEANAAIIEKTLDSFGVQARVAEISLGPAVTQYALKLSEGTKITKITTLQTDLALALAAPTGAVRVEAPIPGKKLVGIEVPNYTPTIVTMKKALMSEPVQQSKAKLMATLGQNVAGETELSDVSKWPHVLIAGATGSGKSVLLHSIIISLLYKKRPDELQFIFIDPKRVELTQYNGIPHLLQPVIVEAEKAVNAFKWAVHEMEHRYKLFQQISGARDLASFNQLTDTSPLPYIVIVVDELADLMSYAKNEAETLITRIAQMSRATGIHLILSTQRPSVDVITGLIKANIPTRIALNVTSITDSRVILDASGAEKLIGRGDMLYLPSDLPRPKRIQGVYVTDAELHRVIEFLRQFKEHRVDSMLTATVNESIQGVQSPIANFPSAAMATTRTPDFEEPEDKKFDEALQEIVNHDRASASLLQRRLKIGYARAARLLDELEERGMVSAPDGSNPREVHTEKVREYLTKAGKIGQEYNQ